MYRLSNLPPTIDFLDQFNLPPIIRNNLPPRGSDWQILPLPFLLLMTIEASIYEICTAFYDNLDRISVQEKFADKLQKFADFQI